MKYSRLAKIVDAKRLIKKKTKTGEDRIVELCPRALEVLKRQLSASEPKTPGLADKLGAARARRFPQRVFVADLDSFFAGRVPSLPQHCARSHLLQININVQ
ncbi:MAG: hypothetical protein WDO68_02010 [Gammaproteobacteria bacterium]